MKKTLVASTICAGLMIALSAGPAAADPLDVADPLVRLDGSGSDTTEVVMRALDAQIPNLGSWDISGPAWDPNGAANAGCEFTGRNAGSGAGRTSLANSVSNGDSCFQFARSSSRATAATPASQAALPYAGTGTTPVPLLPISLAVDGLTYVFRTGSSTPRDLTIGQLRAIYACNFTGVVDGRLMSSPNIPNRPLIPTDLSGTRADWLAFMGQPASPAGAGVSEVVGDGGTLPACIDDGPGDTGQAGGEYSEHNGNVLSTGRQIIVHGTAQYIAQGRSIDGDFRGNALLGYIGGNTPLQAFDNPAGNLSPATPSGSTVVDGAYFRTVFNVIPASQVADPTVVSVFGVRSGGADPAATGDVPNANSGAICNSDDTLISAGFIPVC